MKLYVNVKQLKKRRNRIEPVLIELPQKPRNVRELIEAMVEVMVNDFNERVRRMAQGENPEVPDEEEIDAMAQFGKIAFDLVYGQGEVDMEKAKEAAVSACEDGLVRIFHGEDELGGIDASVELQDEDTLTFLRLAMLAGRMW